MTSVYSIPHIQAAYVDSHGFVPLRNCEMESAQIYHNCFSLLSQKECRIVIKIEL